MDIKTYCKAQSLSQVKFAEMVGVSDAYISQINKGIRRPGPDLAFKIEKLTNGAIPRDQLLFPLLYKQETQ